MDEDTRIHLRDLAEVVEKILGKELGKYAHSFDKVEVRVYDVKSVGVQGDARSYTHPVEITLALTEGSFWDPAFLSYVSLRITNKVRGINRVVYFLASRDV